MPSDEYTYAIHFYIVLSGSPRTKANKLWRIFNKILVLCCVEKSNCILLLNICIYLQTIWSFNLQHTTHFMKLIGPFVDIVTCWKLIWWFTLILFTLIPNYKLLLFYASENFTCENSCLITFCKTMYPFGHDMRFWTVVFPIKIALCMLHSV